MADNSESLLTEILLLVQDLNASVGEFKIHLSKVEQDILQVKQNVDNIILNGFAKADLNAHKLWHEEKNKGWFRRFLGI